MSFGGNMIDIPDPTLEEILDEWSNTYYEEDD